MFLKEKMVLDQSEADACIFTKDNFIAGLYVDDILYSGNRNEIKEFERIIKERYEVRIDNEVKDFLGITITQVKNESKVILRQDSTIKKMAALFHSEIKHLPKYETP